MPRRPGAQKPVDVEDAEGEDEHVDGTEHDQRDGCRLRRQERRHCVGRAQNAVDGPRLPSDFSGEPAGQYCDERKRET